MTGGGGNNGLAVIRMALERGMNVAILSGTHAKAQAAVEKLGPSYERQLVGYAQNPQFRLAQNLETAPEIYNEHSSQEDVLGWIAQRFGGIDVVVNGSGGHKRRSFSETDRSFWRDSMEVLEDTFFSIKLAMPYLLQSKAPRVINLTTCDGRGGGYCFCPAFAAARGGIVSMTRELAKELGPKGITVNCVAIGPIEQDVPSEDGLSPQQRSVLLARTPLGRLGMPQDVAGAVNFLASDEAAFITGAVIDVNGGLITCG